MNNVIEQIKILDNGGYKVLVLGNPETPKVTEVASKIDDAIIVNPENIDEIVEEISKYKKIGIISPVKQTNEYFKRVLNKVSGTSNTELRIYPNLKHE